MCLLLLDESNEDNELGLGHSLDLNEHFLHLYHLDITLRFMYVYSELSVVPYQDDVKLQVWYSTSWTITFSTIPRTIYVVLTRPLISWAPPSHYAFDLFARY